MLKSLVAIFLFFSLASPLKAGVDQVFGEKVSWWTTQHNQLLSYFDINKNYALVVGVGSYSDNAFEPLLSEKDAVRVKDYLINEAGFDHVRLITGDQVTKNKISQLMFDYYPKHLTSKDRFLFYWSGHGVSVGDSRKQGFLAVHNSEAKNVGTMIGMHDLSQWDNRFKAKQALYLLDACFSGIAAAVPMSANKDQTIQRVSRPSRQVLVAGLPDEETITLEDINGGVFTRAVLDGLRGHADTNKGVFKKDGVVTAHELVEYVRERVDHERRRVGWKKTITPRLVSLPRQHQQGDFFFVSDKRILKKITPLKQGSQTKVIATGVRAHGQSKARIQENPIPKSSNGRYINRYRPNGDNIPNIEGHLFVECDGCPKMIVVSGGTFSMGLDSGGSGWPNPKVTVAVNPFALSENLVTKQEYQKCLDSSRCSPFETKGLYAQVTWSQALSYADWLSSISDGKYRLIAESEWEYAALTKSIHKNIEREWTADCWHKGYVGAPTNGKAWTTDCNSTFGDTRVLRGGGSMHNRDGHKVDGYRSVFRVVRDMN